MGRDGLAALEEKLDKLSEEVERDRERFNQWAVDAGRSKENVEQHATVATESVTDELTGLFNRRAFEHALSREAERAARFGGDIALVMIDLNSFKSVNDTHGHAQGDLVLREVARVLREGSREVDHPARYGGEELAVILPGTDLEGAFNCAERIREQIEQLRIPRVDGQGALRVTASCGAASERGALAADGRALVEAADTALLEARRRRGNDDPDGGVREPRRPEPDAGAGGAALLPPNPPTHPTTGRPPDVR